MTKFDRADARLSRAIGALHNEPVEWIPMRPRVSSRYTNEGFEPDPTRPRKMLQAAVTWRPSITAVGKESNDGAVVFADCVVDFEMAVFENPMAPGTFIAPQEHDRFRITEEYAGNDLVEVQRNGDDGSTRIFFYCAPVTE